VDKGESTCNQKTLITLHPDSKRYAMEKDAENRRGNVLKNNRKNSRIAEHNDFFEEDHFMGGGANGRSERKSGTKRDGQGQNVPLF